MSCSICGMKPMVNGICKDCQHKPSAGSAGSIALDVDKLSTDALLRSFAKRLREMQQDLPDEFKQVVEDHFIDLLA